jgi:hypothetical protein
METPPRGEGGEMTGKTPLNYCCGFVPGTNKHQLWCSQHPDRVKERAAAEPPAVEPAPKPNKPEPQSAADRIAQQCAELLDANCWDDLDKYWINIRGVKFWIANNAGDVHIETGASAPQLKDVYPSGDFRHLFFDSYKRFLHRETERRAALVEADLKRKLSPPPPAETPPRKRSWWRG